MSGMYVPMDISGKISDKKFLHSTAKTCTLYPHEYKKLFIHNLKTVPSIRCRATSGNLVSHLFISLCRFSSVSFVGIPYLSFATTKISDCAIKGTLKTI
jgi:hypothetical protein